MKRNSMEKPWLKHYPQQVPAEINADAYPSLVALFHASCRRFADLPAISNLGYQLPYRRLAELSQHFATFLQQTLKHRKGDRLAIMLPNVLQYPVVVFGALQAGLTLVNINPLYTAPELIHQINDAGATTIVVLANFAQTVEKALPQTQLQHVIVTEVGDLLPWPKSVITHWLIKYVRRLIPKWSISNAITLKQALAQGRAASFTPVIIKGDDLALLQYTGGTTGGKPKGVMLSHRNLVANVEQMVAWVKTTLVEGREIAITAIPLYHIFSFTVNLLVFLRLGGLNIFITNPRDFPGFIRKLKRTPFTVITGVNTLFNALLNHPDFNKLDFSPLKIAFGGGAAIQSTVAERWQQTTGKILLEGYGLTEASPVVSACPVDFKMYKKGIGLPVPSTEVTFHDEHGDEVPCGEPGELYVKGPQVMQGYWQHPEETQQALTADGRLKTGDIGCMDPDGFMRILERKKDLILVSGFNVYPNEIEEVLSACPGVKEAAVIGVPDQTSGEAVKAFVVRQDPNLRSETLIEHCRQNLTGYKRPKTIVFRDSLPKSAVGKILRRELREPFIDSLEQQH